jgi:hypothetical protein
MNDISVARQVLMTFSEWDRLNEVLSVFHREMREKSKQSETPMNLERGVMLLFDTNGQVSKYFQDVMTRLRNE